MSSYNRNSKKPVEEIQVPQVHFLGEQDGPPERELKSRLTDLFQHQSVERGYLARVVYEGDGVIAVALCIRRQIGPDSGLAEKVGQIFAAMFGKDQRLDIIFLSGEQETELANTCRPFFKG
jgi:hypothetical protein